jgi:hypothetical protein
MVLKVPVATDRGKPIVSKVRTEIVVDEKGVKSQPLSGDERVKSYPAASRDKILASLTDREKSYGPRIPKPFPKWEYPQEDRAGKETVNKQQSRLSFVLAHIYTIHLSSKEPLVLGLPSRAT